LSIFRKELSAYFYSSEALSPDGDVTGNEQLAEKGHFFTVVSSPTGLIRRSSWGSFSPNP